MDLRQYSNSTDMSSESQIDSFEMKINNTRLSLLYAVMPDYDPLLNSQSEVSSNNADRSENETHEFKLEIDVSTATGRSNTGEQLIPTKARFEIRAQAFNYLSTYFNSFKKDSEVDDIELRSTSPLKMIFDYQEEHIFDVKRDMSPSNITIKVSSFDDATKNSANRGSFNKSKKVRKHRVKKSKRKNTSFTSLNMDSDLSIFQRSDILSGANLDVSGRKISTNSSKQINANELLKPSNAPKVSRKNKSKRRHHKSI